MSLPGRLLCVERAGAELVLDWLTARDHPWLRELIEVCEGLGGQSLDAVHRQLADFASDPRAGRRGGCAVAVLVDRLTQRAQASIAPPRARAEAFAAAAAGLDRIAALARAAARLGVEPADVEAALFADLPGERCLGALDPIGPAQLALACNLALAQGALRRSRSVRLTVLGNARDVARQARLGGLLCEARVVAGGGCRLEIAGPRALPDPGRRYGRALAALLPRALWCHRFRLEAECEIGGERGLVVLRSGDPLPAGPAPVEYDSALERRLARELRAAAPRIEVVREPAAVPAGDVLVFPDFLLRDRERPEHWCFVEVVGFWTPDYLARKLASLERARVERVVLCVDERCGAVLPAAGQRVVRFARRIPAAEVLAAMRACADEAR